MSRAYIAVFILLLFGVGVTTSSAAAVWSFSAFPVLGRTMPEVEQALLQGIKAADVDPQVVWIGADTNGHLTVASIVFSTAGVSPTTTPKSLDGRAWKLAQLAFAAVPSLDEVHLSGVLPPDGGVDLSRLTVVYSGAISRRDLAAATIGGSETLGRVSRVWYGLGSVQARSISSEYRSPGSAKVLGGSTTLVSALPIAAAPVPPNPFPVREKRLVSKPLQIVFQGNPNRPEVAVTFDDGPFPIYTTLLLDTLERMNVKATFFLVGEQVQRYPYFAQAIVKAGHEVGNHTFHHVRLSQLPEPVIAEEIVRAQEVITEVTGYRPIYFRPPGGRFALSVIRTASGLGLTTVFWTANSGDYTHQGVPILEAKILGRVHRGGILLLHQGVGETTRILPGVFDVLRQRGLLLTTVTALLASPPHR